MSDAIPEIWRSSGHALQSEAATTLNQSAFRSPQSAIENALFAVETVYTTTYNWWVRSLQAAARAKSATKKRREAGATLAFLEKHDLMSPSLAKTKCVDDEQVENPLPALGTVVGGLGVKKQAPSITAISS